MTASTSHHPHLSVRNIANALLVLVVPIPSFLAARWAFAHCSASDRALEPVTDALLSEHGVPALLADAWSAAFSLGTAFYAQDTAAVQSAWCDIAIDRPLLAINVSFFFNVNVLFWLISLIQQSTWLIDPYWTILPPLMAAFFCMHPLASGLVTERTLTAVVLLCLWSIRLTHSYFRREDYKFGVREDWRFAHMRNQSPIGFAITCFFSAFASQQLMLVGLVLPIYALAFVPPSEIWKPLDFVAIAIASGGLVIAYIADTQLRNFMLENERRRTAGKSPIKILRSGLWRYARHPNYFGEVSWWTGLALLASSVGCWWAIVGTLFNTMVMAHVTSLTEARMRSRPERAKEWKEYCEQTSVWIPLPPRRTAADKSA